MYIPPSSYKARVRHEGLHWFQILATEDMLPELSPLMDKMREIHKVIPLRYYTCACYEKFTLWFFAYDTIEEKEAVMAQMQIIQDELVDDPNKKTIEEHLREYIQANAEACSCPFKI